MLTQNDADAILAQIKQTLQPFVTGTTSASPVPLAYRARTDLTAAPKPSLPVMGSAGAMIVDPTFSTPVTRVTDSQTAPWYPGCSFRTPSNLQMRSWSADGRMFYLVNDSGDVTLFDFDPATKAAKLRAWNPIRSVAGEPDFHPTQPGHLICASPTDYVIKDFAVVGATFTPLLDLQTLTAVNLSSPRTYVGGCGISQNAKRLFAFFGGTQQDLHTLLAVKDLPSGKVWLLDTMAGTLNGQPAPVPQNGKWGWHIHAVTLDRSGQFLRITTSGMDGNWGPNWDIDNNTFDLIVDPNFGPGGHEAFAYGYSINQAAISPWDYAQWQLRKLTRVGLYTPQALINPVLTPKEMYAADHTSWHNAQPDRLVPVISGMFRYYAAGKPAYDWRAWDDELIAIQTDVPAGQGAKVWRLAHHRSNVIYESATGVVDATRNNFWAEPRPQVSPRGLDVLFTSNWERSLGKQAMPGDGSYSRQDVFLLSLTGA